MFLILHFSAEKSVLPLPFTVILLNSLTAVISKAERHPSIYGMQADKEQMLESPKSVCLTYFA